MLNNPFTDNSSFCDTVTRPHNSLENRTVLESPQIWLLTPKCTERLCLRKEWTKREKKKTGKKHSHKYDSERSKVHECCSTVLLKSFLHSRKSKILKILVQVSKHLYGRWAKKTPLQNKFIFLYCSTSFSITCDMITKRNDVIQQTNKQTKPTNLYTVSLGPCVKDGLRIIRVKHQTQRETWLACGGRRFICRPLCSRKVNNLVTYSKRSTV